MTKQRLIQTMKLYLLKGKSRESFMRKVFAGYGEHVSYFPRVMPLYPELIKFGNNIVLASGVNFVTHDAIHAVLNGLPEENGGGIREFSKSGLAVSK